MPGSSSRSMRSRGSILPCRASRSRSRCGRVCRAASCLSRNSRASSRLCASLARNSALEVEIVEAMRRIVRSALQRRKLGDDLVLVEGLADAARRASASTPSRGALSVICSFMLSIVTSASPRATASPGCLWMRTTVPGIGARTWSWPPPPRSAASRGSIRRASNVRPAKPQDLTRAACARAKSNGWPSISIVRRPSAPLSGDVTTHSRPSTRTRERTQARRSPPRARAVES